MYLLLLIVVIVSLFTICDSFIYNNILNKPKMIIRSTSFVSMSTSKGNNANKNDNKNKVSWRAPTGKPDELMRELLAGAVVGVATIPTSISYSTVIGINPIIGIWNSAILGLIVTIVGGAPGNSID